MPDDDVTLYFNPRCSKCRGARELLVDQGADIAIREYLNAAPDRAELDDLMRMLGIDDPRAMMRTGEPIYTELGLADADTDQLLQAVEEHPILLERPIVVRGDRAVIARPPEKLLDLL